MRLARCSVIAALAAGLLSPAATAQAEPLRAAKTSTITLISGDKVVVNEQGELVRVEGRPGMQFAQYVQNDHQYVVPADAVDAVGQDRVDKRFFDVTSLHGYGYTDDKIDRIPLLSNGFRAAGAVQKKDAAQQWTARRTSALSVEASCGSTASRRSRSLRACPWSARPVRGRPGSTAPASRSRSSTRATTRSTRNSRASSRCRRTSPRRASRTTSGTARTSRPRSRGAAASTSVSRRAPRSRWAASARPSTASTAR